MILTCAPHAQVGFQRFQVNATSANGVDTSVFGTAEGARQCVAALRTAFASLTQVEFIMQRNSETRPLWELLEAEMPPNVSLLFDDSMGLGKCRCGQSRHSTFLVSPVYTNKPRPLACSTEWPSPPPPEVKFGYAGGLGPQAGQGAHDMRSFIRKYAPTSGRNHGVP